MSEERSFPTPP